MSTDRLTVRGVVPLPRERIFDGFLDPSTHGEMTGAHAALLPDGRFSAWGGYITARTIEQQRPSRILQDWRTSEFPSDAPDSRLEILLEPCPRGTRLTFVHSQIPRGQGAAYRGGWREYYLRPMRAWARGLARG